MLTSQPVASQVAGTPVTPTLVAELRNASSAVVTSYNGSATLALGANPSEITVPAVTVSSSGATSGTTSPFNVGAALAATPLIQSGASPLGTYGTVLAAQVVDAFGNPVAGTNVTFSVAAGGGALSAPNIVVSP